MLTDEYFMRCALSEAQAASEQNEIPVGCIVVLNDRIISRSHNLTETLNDVTAHAEMQAITSAANCLGGKYLVNCTMYVTLEPCTMCAGALAWSQITRLVIGARDENRGFISQNIKIHPKTEIITGILEDESKELLKTFFRKRR